jgi:hypothetical protein
VQVAAYVLAFFVAGCIFAILPVLTLCSLPGVRFSNACGHNAAYWFILTIPVGFVILLVCTLRLAERRKRIRDAVRRS